MTSDDKPAGRARPQPRYPRFLVTGASAGLLVAVLVAGLAPSSARYSRTSVLLYVGLLTVLVGALLGGLLAVALERGGRAEGTARRGGPRRR